MNLTCTILLILLLLWSIEGFQLSLSRDLEDFGKSSFPRRAYSLNNGVVLWIAYDPQHGFEWRTTNGTSENHYLLMDINSGRKYICLK